MTEQKKVKKRYKCECGSRVVDLNRHKKHNCTLENYLRMISKDKAKTENMSVDEILKDAIQ